MLETGEPEACWSHGDIWLQVSPLLLSNADRLKFTWCPSHLTQEQAVAKGFQADHWHVNRGADQLASEGILLNAPALAVRISVLARASQALRWQATMLDILEKRWSSKPLPHRSAGYTQQQLDALE